MTLAPWNLWQCWRSLWFLWTAKVIRQCNIWVSICCLELRMFWFHAWPRYFFLDLQFLMFRTGFCAVEGGKGTRKNIERVVITQQYTPHMAMAGSLLLAPKLMVASMLGKTLTHATWEAPKCSMPTSLCPAPFFCRSWPQGLASKEINKPFVAYVAFQMTLVGIHKLISFGFRTITLAGFHTTCSQRISTNFNIFNVFSIQDTQHRLKIFTEAVDRAHASEYWDRNPKTLKIFLAPEFLRWFGLVRSLVVFRQSMSNFIS